jgi:hypothetical protein
MKLNNKTKHTRSVMKTTTKEKYATMNTNAMMQVSRLLASL